VQDGPDLALGHGQDKRVRVDVPFRRSRREVIFEAFFKFMSSACFLIQNTQPDADRFDSLSNSLFNLIRPNTIALIASHYLSELINFQLYGGQHRIFASVQAAEVRVRDLFPNNRRKGVAKFNDWCLSIDELVGNHFRRVPIQQISNA